MLTITGLHKAFGNQDLFVEAELQVGARHRVALVGPNGSGKTTLLNMIAGEELADRGVIRLAKALNVGYLRQETDALRGRPLLEEVVSHSRITDTEHRLSILENEMAETPPGPELDALLAEYGRLQERFAHMGGFSLEFEAKKVLAGLGFREADHDRPTESFSGGWLMRIALAKLLLTSPDLLLLDEPTNHLDLASVEWLEKFLKAFEGSLLFVSHDRDLMNGLATRVVEIDRKKLVSYTGNYDAFVTQKELASEQLSATARKQALEVEKTQRFIDRFRAKESKARQVQSRIKMLDRMERVDVPKISRRAMGLSFPLPARPARTTVELTGVRFGYDDRAVYESLNLAIERTHKIALVGPNGAGKTTLLKLVAGVLHPQGGERIVGGKVNLGYFAQHQIEALDPSKRVLEEFESSVPAGVVVQPRSLLGRFLFHGDDVFKRVRVLSGGERTRLALAKLLVARPNMLCLDEPTNHLDIQSRQVVEAALVDYTSALILITHDRHLIRTVANRIVEVIDGHTTVYHGGYDYYLFKREHQHLPSPDQSSPAEPPRQVRTRPQGRRGSSSQDQRSRLRVLRARVRSLERAQEIASAEARQIELILAKPETYQSGDELTSLLERYEDAQRRVEQLERDWERAAESLETLQSD